MTNGYLETISLVERLHRHFLELVKLELDGLGVVDPLLADSKSLHLALPAKDLASRPSMFGCL